MCTFLVPLLVGATITYPPSLKGPELIGTIRNQAVTILIGIPRLLEMILNAIDNKIKARPATARAAIAAMLSISNLLRRTLDVNVGRHFFKAVHETFGGQLRFISSGGAKLRPELMKRLESYGFTIVEGYGLTETSPVVTFNPLGRRRPGSAGVPVKGAHIKAPVKSGSATTPEGEILIKGPMVTMGYLNMPDETAKAFLGSDVSERWFQSGDLGYLDNDGYLFITGRSKEVIVLSSGKNIYPEDVEQKYSAIALIKEICVYADGDRLEALIVPDMDYARKMKVATVETAIKWEVNNVSTGLPSYMRIKGFTLYSEPLPRTRLGKLQRFLIKGIRSSIHEERQSEPSAAAQTISDSYTSALISIIRDLMELKRSVSLDENLELDLGIDSLKRLELLSAIEEHFKVRLPEAFGQDVHTVKELSEGLSAFYEGAGGDSSVSAGEVQGGFKEILNTPPDEDALKQIGLNNTPLERVFTKAILWIIRQCLKVFYRGQLRGIENLVKPPYIVCPNHSSYLDAFIVAALVPGDVFNHMFFQGAEEIFRSAPARVFARLGHVIPIDPNVSLTKAMAMSAYLLRQGLSLCIFPEGGRAVDGTLQEFKKGVGILSKECGVPIVPMRIDGAYEALPRGAFWPRLSRITLSCGKPVYPDGNCTYQSISEEVKLRIAQMGI
uniref:Long-chain-fatty-acid CoA ligase n=1 Tax=uncultured Nitrospirae bacterium MY3-5B TaxID=798578 RepID=D9MP27_9BACT|nr:long-chain-fatty-acid CoA ligase [uncultured Nitrospirae bacterium MY3-5B]